MFMVFLFGVAVGSISSALAILVFTVYAKACKCSRKREQKNNFDGQLWD